MSKCPCAMAAGTELSASGTKMASAPRKNLTKTDCSTASAAIGMKPDDWLGKYRMIHGTGIQRDWHDNGKLQIEVSTVHGEFCGRNRIWLRDGTLLTERFYLHGLAVSAKTYRAAAAKDKTLPRFRGKPAKLTGKNRVKPTSHSPRLCGFALGEAQSMRSAEMAGEKNRRPDCAFARTIQTRE